MKTDLHWIPGPWIGRLAIMPRPRGNDWLEDEIQSWRQSGVDAIVSLLTPEEIAEMGLGDEAEFSRTAGIRFGSFPIVDRDVPKSRSAFLDFVTELAEQLAEGKSVAVHCRQGIGRAALVAICLLVLGGVELETAIQQVGSARGCVVPETAEQKRWIADFAKASMTPLPK